MHELIAGVAACTGSKQSTFLLGWGRPYKGPSLAEELMAA